VGSFVEPAKFEAFLRGCLDGQLFWSDVTWNMWGELTVAGVNAER
jgi:hypothetical protein